MFAFALGVYCFRRGFTEGGFGLPFEEGASLT